LILLCRSQSASQLVGARSALAVAIYAAQAVNNFANRHTLNEFANALQVAVAAAGENHISHRAVNHVKVYKLRASPARPILIMHNQIQNYYIKDTNSSSVSTETFGNFISFKTLK
jgi:poly(3-hydroxyalkanoate) synthetase